jgi:aminoglycoside phosphotransferase (APT) family kinase protein
MVAERALLDDLLVVLRRETGAEVAFAGEPTPLTGGFWAQLVSFRLAGAPAGWDGPLVARVMPDAAIAAKETAFQGAVADQGYPTPAVHAAGGPEAGITGQAYLVMDLADGQPLLSGLDGVAAIRRLPSLARQLPKTLARVLAALHRLDREPVVKALDAAGAPHPTLPAMLASLRANADGLGRSDLVAVVDWLETHPPDDEQVVLCHGDMHPFNVLVADDGALTVLDWSAAMLTPATYDLGVTSLMLAEPPLVVPGLLRGVIRRAGAALSRRFVRAYESASGTKVDPEALAWHQALIGVRALLEVASWSTAGTLNDRRGHPWVIGADAFAGRLTRRTGTAVRAH